VCLVTDQRGMDNGNFDGEAELKRFSVRGSTVATEERNTEELY